MLFPHDEEMTVNGSKAADVYRCVTSSSGSYFALATNNLCSCLVLRELTVGGKTSSPQVISRGDQMISELSRLVCADM